MPPRCASCGCWYGPASKERGVSFHKFPRDHDRLQRWLVSMRNNLVNKLTPEKIKELVHKKDFHWRVCSDHFQPGCFTRSSVLKRQLCPDHPTTLELEKDAVPTLFSGPGENDRNQGRPPSKYQQRKEHSREP
ncbi:hypothetical protein Bbelb_271200 [Branchiostoma belcheri]|nr:hypothetical protein Bbelb_271200 [Branchiostoma belcheri]